MSMKFVDRVYARVRLSNLGRLVSCNNGEDGLNKVKRSSQMSINIHKVSKSRLSFHHAKRIRSSCDNHRGIHLSLLHVKLVATR